MKTQLKTVCLIFFAAALLNACGGGSSGGSSGSAGNGDTGGNNGGGSNNGTGSDATYTISGVVTGLTAGQHVTLLNNGADAQTVTSDTGFGFDVGVAQNGSYAVTVGTQPVGETCTVTQGSGEGVVANIGNVAVTCSATTYTIAGTVTGLTSGQQVTLLNNSADAQTVTSNTAFRFDVGVAQNSGYAVTVGTQPAGETCTVTQGSSDGVVTNISNVAVTCSATTYTIAGTVTGLTSGQQVTLLNNGADAQRVTSNTGFRFDVGVVQNGSYAVTVGTQPAGETCTVSQGSGAGVVANISSVAVTCSPVTYTIAGTVRGLASGQQVTLLNNGADGQTVTSNTGFSFDVGVVQNSSYAVTVGTQPIGQTCTVVLGSGVGIFANVSNVSVICSTSLYTISGTVAGLGSGEQVTLNNNGANPTTVSANGAFSFTTQVVYGGNYAVTVATPPLGQICTTTNGSGTNIVANVGNVAISCEASTETVLHSFAGSPDGGFPYASLILGGDGNFYGTTYSDGTSNNGTVFKITPAGVETVLYSFTGGTDGANPYAGLILGADGNFYGTTYQGGANNNGTVFKITPAGVETVLYSFTGGTDGANPYAGLILGADGNFYGTTYQGGANNNGTVFKITPAGVETVLYSFAGGTDGAHPYAGLILGNDGNFYGTTISGGASNFGTAFKITPAGTETVLHSFASADGVWPYAGLILGNDGNFYGTTAGGGTLYYGTVFNITPAGVLSVVHAFNGTEGGQPYAGLILGSDGNFYGTTVGGGTAIDYGTIFKITPAGVLSVVYSFSGTDGASPYAGLILGSDGHFYGTTTAGGSGGDGTVFRY